MRHPVKISFLTPIVAGCLMTRAAPMALAPAPAVEEEEGEEVVIRLPVPPVDSRVCQY